MLVVTNLVLPSVLFSNTLRYDTTRQRFDFARGLLDFCRLVVTNFSLLTDDNVHLRKLQTAYLSHSGRGQQRRGFWRATPPRGVFRVVTVAVPTPTCKEPQKSFPLKKRGAKNEQ